MAAAAALLRRCGCARPCSSLATLHDTPRARRTIMRATRGSSSSRLSAASAHGTSPHSPSSPPRARDLLLRRRGSAPCTSSPHSSSSSTAVTAPAAPTLFVPRDPAIRDGVWTDVDQQQVAAAQVAAAQPGHPCADLRGFVLLAASPEGLADLAVQLGHPRYRGQQMWASLLRGARSIGELRGLPRVLLDQLGELGIVTGRSAVHHRVVAGDGVIKLLLRLAGSSTSGLAGHVVETVGIPAKVAGQQRLTVCVSSQVGCPMRCSFCATGRGGFARNLAPHEIVDQVLSVGEAFSGQRVTNVVFMGQGEPLLNVPAVVAAVDFMRHQLGLSGRAITISTVGVPNAIARLAEAQLTATLAVSLHAPNQALREELIPSARVYPLEALMRDCCHYFKQTGRRVTWEYTLMSGVNDSRSHAEELVALLKRHKLLSHVNLIPWNAVEGAPYQCPSSSRVRAFKQVLQAAGLPVSVRTTRGLEAAAACGQLRNEFQKARVEQPVPRQQGTHV